MDIYEMHSETMFIETIKAGIASGATFMGDTFAGFKFVGPKSKYWNTLMAATCPDQWAIDLIKFHEIKWTPLNKKEWSNDSEE